MECWFGFHTLALYKNSLYKADAVINIVITVVVRFICKSPYHFVQGPWLFLYFQQAIHFLGVVKKSAGSLGVLGLGQAMTKLVQASSFSY